MAGYSGTPLQKKLGIKAGYAMYVADAPSGYFQWLAPLPERIEIRIKLTGTLDFIHIFVKNKKLFETALMKGKKHLKPGGMLWVSWPKKASGVMTDLDENIIRESALASGLVDVKVCAVDETWSSLKLVVPLKDR